MNSELELHRVVFSIVCASELRFPEVDQGFKGSAWHGRVDHAVRCFPDLSVFLPNACRPGDPARYWLEAPEDRVDGVGGPFAVYTYPRGKCFELTVFFVGAPLSIAVVSAFTEALRRAGHVDPASLTHPETAAKRLCGKFLAQLKATETFPINQLQAPVLRQEQASLALEFYTMLRLDDGHAVIEATQQLRNGKMYVPRLSALSSKVLNRVQMLGLKNPWLVPSLQNIAMELSQCEPTIKVEYASVYPCDIGRLSARTGRRDPMGGLIGSVEYSGPAAVIAQALTLFKLAQWTRIGRKTSLGAGRIRAELLTDSL